MHRAELLIRRKISVTLVDWTYTTDSLRCGDLPAHTYLDQIYQHDN